MELLTNITALSGVVDKALARVLAPYDLTTVEFNCLWRCLELEGETTATELVSHLPVDASRVSRVVTTLVDKGLLVRRRRRSDRRIVMLRLSDEGDELAQRIRRSVNLLAARLTEGVGERELQGFASFSSTVIANYDAINRPE